jgi:hypothetical protein
MNPANLYYGSLEEHLICLIFSFRIRPPSLYAAVTRGQIPFQVDPGDVFSIMEIDDSLGVDPLEPEPIAR